MHFNKSCLALVFATAFGPAMAASAMYSLTIVDPAAGLGSGPFGNVTLTENSGNVDFSIVLNPTSILNPVDTGKGHVYFAFMAQGVALGDIQNIIAADLDGRTLGAVSNPKNAPFGTFNFGIACAAGCGGNNEISDPLSFTVMGSSLADFGAGNPLNISTGGDYQVYFAADIRNIVTEKTGAVGAVSVVPEPEGYAMAMAALGVLGVFGRLRRSRA